jgi:hypothetical protein
MPEEKSHSTAVEIELSLTLQKNKPQKNSWGSVKFKSKLAPAELVFSIKPACRAWSR